MGLFNVSVQKDYYGKSKSFFKLKTGASFRYIIFDRLWFNVLTRQHLKKELNNSCFYFKDKSKLNNAFKSQDCFCSMFPSSDFRI